MNPLLHDWNTPFGVPPFDAIRPEHFRPAFDHAMAEHLDQIAAIGAERAPPSFDNTVVALERSGQRLDRVSAVFGNLVVSLGGAALEALDTELAPLLAAHAMRVALDAAVFRRLDALNTIVEQLDLAVEERRLLERLHRRRVRSGAALGDVAKTRLTAIAERLAALHTRFGQNVLHDERAWHLPLDADALDGLPPFVRDGAREAAASRGLDGWCLTLARSLIEPFLGFSTRRDLRAEAWRAWTARGTHPGPHDNRPLIPEILALRAERARLLGEADYTRLAFLDTMAGSPEAAEALLEQVWQPARRKAQREAERLTAEAHADGVNGALEAWDWRFYAERVRARDYALDEAALKPYFPLDRIERAAFDTAARLFGLRFTARPDLPVYHPDVRAFEVADADGHVGVFLVDHFARPDKRSGAWMSSYRDQQRVDAPIAPIIVNNNNFTRGTPTLLSFDDARTLFHEFGHGLHGLLSRVRFPTQSGTSVRRDFVEFPSQILEHWFELPDTLRAYARHHDTGDALPDATIERIRAARGFDQGFATVSFTASALIDLALHRHPDPATLDVDAFEAAFLARLGVPDAIGLRHRPAHFQHLFAGDGYACGYYAYLWAEVLDADGFEAFEEAGDPFDAALASKLRTVLAAGDTIDPMALYTGFRGRAPDVAALLRGRDLVERETT